MKKTSVDRLWFSGRVLFASSHFKEKDSLKFKQSSDVLIEESIILVRSEDEDGAKKELERVAKKHEISYENNEGELVRWCYLGVVEIQELDEEEVGEGVFVFTRMFWKSDVSDKGVVEFLKNIPLAQ